MNPNNENVFKNLGIKWILDLMQSYGKVEEIEDCLYKVETSEVVMLLGVSADLHPNVSFRLAIENKKAYNKISQVPVNIDIFDTTKEEITEWINFMGTERGYQYSTSFEYLDDETRPCVIYSVL